MQQNDTQSESAEGRYASFETEDDQFILYDRNNSEAWLQSDAAVSLKQ